jgi:uncharacterized protein YbjT (DUF2867 family)
MSTITNIAIAGASGSLGSVVLQGLVNTGAYKITVLRRQGSSATFPEGTKVVDVDFSSVESLKSALGGQDVVISALGTLAIDGQFALVDAVAAAGVKRFIPSEFGSNLDNPNTRRLPVFAQKIKVQDYIIEKSKSTPLTYTFVYNGAFLDWGLEHGFVLQTSNYKPTIIDGGDNVFSTTTLASVADAVVGILKNLEETKNRAVYIEDMKITQNKLLALAKEVAPSKPWETVPLKLDDLTAASDARLAKGLYDMETFAPYLFRAILDPAYGGNFEKVDNDLLGVKGATDADIIQILKKLIN